jgi:DNA-binding beta-propeller fold protein YncE
VDAQRRLLFVANYNSARLAVVDLRTLRVLGSQPLGAGPDVLAFDAVWRRLYVASESGVVSVFTELDTALVAEGSLTIQYAHTVAADPRSHLIYLALQDVNGQPMLWIMAGTPPAPSGPVQIRAVPFEPAALAFRHAAGF